MEHDEGWTFAAAIVLGVAGIMRVFDAIWAFRYHGVLPSNLEDAIFGHSLKTYGWVYIVVAAILVLSALAIIMSRSQIGRWIGVAAGAIMAISAIWWMPYYPIWSLTYIAIGVFVIYALAAHGPRGSDCLKRAQQPAPRTIEQTSSEPDARGRRRWRTWTARQPQSLAGGSPEIVPNDRNGGREHAAITLKRRETSSLPGCRFDLLANALGPIHSPRTRRYRRDPRWRRQWRCAAF